MLIHILSAYASMEQSIYVKWLPCWAAPTSARPKSSWCGCKVVSVYASYVEVTSCHCEVVKRPGWIMPTQSPALPLSTWVAITLMCSLMLKSFISVNSQSQLYQMMFQRTLRLS